ncbi:MAG: trypsin-like peptidase domain-containing protein [Hydrococcus sp. C42_A2020_068]|nr:trypsin-like peptidase domain-containing protein [Hydrococcus sp. C42_A2020_068]
MSKFTRKFYFLVICGVIVGILILSIARLDRLRTNISVTTEKESISRHPNAIAALEAGIESYQHSQMLDAEIAFRKAIAQDANLAEAYNNLGVILFWNDRSQDAIAAFRKALDLKPSYRVANTNLGWLLKTEHYFQEFIEAYAKKMPVNPNESLARYSLILKPASDRWDYSTLAQAIEQYRSQVKRNPRSAWSHYNLGIVLDMLGDLPAAIAEYQIAVDLQSDFAEAHSDLGNVLGILGKEKQAIFHLTKARDLFRKKSKIDYRATNNYDAWQAEQLIAQFQSKSDNKKNLAFNSSKLMATAFVEEGKILSPDRVYAKVSPSIVCIEKETSQDGECGGGGIIVTSDGLVLTNQHVIGTKSTVSVKLKDGRKLTGKVFESDLVFDLALLKLQGANDLPKVTWADTKIKDEAGGELILVDSNPVYAIGFPFPEEWKMSNGQVLKLQSQKIQSYRTLLKAFITSSDLVLPGYSGGPLINSYGQAIGITSHRHRKTGVGRHISVGTIRGFIDEVVPWLRITNGRWESLY